MTFTLASSVNMNVSMLQDTENNKILPTKEALYAIANFLNVPMTAILFSLLSDGDYEDENMNKLFVKAKPVIDAILDALLKSGNPQRN